MTRTTTICVLALLLALTAESASARQGAGCWRTATARQKAAARLQNPRQVETGDRTHYIGKKKGLVILAEFTDMKFRSGHGREKYNDILNSPGYTTTEGFIGSVADYFRDQSAGQFELTFDVVGPYTTKYPYKHYGENDENDEDVHPEEMIAEMCIAAANEVNYADYDWDGDGEVDEVFVVYAGKGEADSYNTDIIWPHMWTMEEATGQPLQIGDMTINVYACSNELRNSGLISGIGTFCHEFSHCLGFPDFYDINYNGQFGMSDFDLMSGGNHGGNGFCPVGYTAYEKMMCGWQEPTVLGSEDVTVGSMKPISEQGETFIIYNEAWPDEYYMIENRQLTGWDAKYPAKGLMITHIDFDKEVWVNNIPNTIYTQEEAIEDGLTCGNDHQRMTFFHADGNNRSVSTSLYPYLRRDSLTATSKPAATLFHENKEGQLLMPGAILDIHQYSDGTMSFRYEARRTIANGIQTMKSPTLSADAIYSIDGRRIDVTDVQSLQPGIYIVGGKKKVVR